MKKTIGNLLIILCCFQTAKSQITSADSIFLNQIFSESLYIDQQNYPGNWFHLPPINNLNSLYNQINQSFPFYNSELLSAFDSAVVQNGFYYDTSINEQVRIFDSTYSTQLFLQSNPFVKLEFNLFNKIAVTSLLFDSCSTQKSPSSVFFILSGTGTNQLSSIANSNANYHNTNCFVRTHLKQYGDICVMGCANEDNRAIQFNYKKLGRYYPSLPTFLSTYLADSNKSMGVNKLIESIAVIKYLKTQYNHVYVLGLSTGGTEALWVSLLTEPDAAIISSGYSILCDSDANSLNVNHYFYSNYLEYFNRDTLKSRLSNINTRFLFTQAQNDNSLVQLEIDSNYTPKYFNGLTNVDFNYSIQSHSFPSCEVIDSFFAFTNIDTQIELTTKSLKIKYTNPVWGPLHIDVEQNKIVPYHITVYDILGQKVLSRKTNKNSILIDLSALQNGIYILQISLENKNYSYRINKI